jgi:hypothetical protein
MTEYYFRHVEVLTQVEALIAAAIVVRVARVLDRAAGQGFSQIRLKSCEPTFFDTAFVRQNMCVRTVF